VVGNIYNMENLEQQIIKKIENIKPEARWKFVLKNIFIWLAAGLCIIFSSLALSVIIYLLKNSDWALYHSLAGSFIKFLALTMPYLWLVFLAIFTCLVYYNFKKTKKGYKYTFSIILLGTIILNVLLGILFYNFGIAHSIDNTFNEKVPLYRKMLEHRNQPWQQPEKGFLAGVIAEIKSDEEFILKDLRGKNWQILHQTPAQEMDILKQIERVKVMGEKINEYSFKADQIRPLRSMPSNKPPLINDFHMTGPGFERKN